MFIIIITADTRTFCAAISVIVVVRLGNTGRDRDRLSAAFSFRAGHLARWQYWSFHVIEPGYSCRADYISQRTEHLSQRYLCSPRRPAGGFTAGGRDISTCDVMCCNSPDVVFRLPSAVFFGMTEPTRLPPIV